MSEQVARTNWARNIVFRASAFHRPDTVAQVQALVAGSSKIRALGTGHSFSDIADTTGDLVSLAGLPRRIEVDTDARTVTLSAGLTYGEVGLELERHGLALPNTGSLPHIAVAGASSTGTHGSGNSKGNLSTAVSAVEMVTADGDLVTFDRTHPDFGGLVLSLGSVGMFTALTLEVEPSFIVRQDIYDNVPQAEIIDRYDEIMASGDSVSVFSNWKQPRVHHIWRKRRTTLDDTAVAEPWLGTLADGQRSPFGPGFDAANVTQQGGVPGPWHERMFHFRHDFTPSNGAELQSEYMLPRERAAEALRALDDIGDLMSEVLLTHELRTIAADELWISPSHRMDSAGFHFTWTDDLDAVLPVVRAVEERLWPLGARPHWAKVTTVTPDLIETQFPRIEDFRGLLRRMDPAGKFRNDLVERLVRP